jgi:alpha-L-fucosidase 2
MTSRRAVLGSAIGGTTLAALPEMAHAATPSPSQAGGRWRLRNRMESDAAWADFLRQQDLVWHKMPTLWHEGPFLGDGRLGSMVYRDPETKGVRFTVQHGEVQDHRPQFGSGWGTCRLPVGHLTLDPVGTITAVDWRLSLWDAELTGTITTDKGSLKLSALIHDGIFAARATADGDEEVRWTFHPEEAISPRKIS